MDPIDTSTVPADLRFTGYGIPGASAVGGPPAQPPADTATRVLAVLGGALALLLGTVLSLGLGLVAVAGIGMAALVRRGRLTRVTSVAGAVLFVALAFGGLTGWVFSQFPGGVVGFSRQMEQAQEEAKHQPQPPIIQKMQKMFPQNPVAQRQTERMINSRAWMWSGMAIGLLTSCVFFGVLIGVPAWGCVMLIGYGVLGRWPLARKPAAT